jgi:diguanylate cyclase (GGDEF)-like protein
MSERKPTYKVRNLQWQVFGVISVLVSLVILYYYFFQNISLFASFINWVLALSIAGGGIGVSFKHINSLQAELAKKISLLEKQSQRDAALAQLSGGFSATQDEARIYQELLERLQSVQGYDYIAVFTYDPTSGNRVLQIEAVKEELPSKPVLGPGEGLSERPILDGKLHYSADITKEPNHVPGLTQGSEIDVPIEYDGSVMGVLVIESTEINAFSKNDFEMLTIIARQAALALKNARLYRGIKDSADRQAILYQASQEIIQAGLDLEIVYQSIHHAAAQLMPANAFVISLLDEDAHEIIAAYLFDKGERSEPRRIPEGTGLSGHIIKTGEPLLTFDYSGPEDLNLEDVFHFGSGNHVRSLLAVPMRLGGKVTGMLSAQTYKTYDYTSQDQQLLEMLAAYAAIAINNANLFSEVQRLAITDSLTGAYNRRYFFDAVEKELARSCRYKHPISILMLDLDFYKEINDSHGHDIGDQALKLITQRCLENIRESDILARYGGDEFVILLPETTVEQAKETAERLRSNMAKHPIQINSIEFSTTISVGVSGANHDPPELSELLKHADIALYDAKQAGRNCVRIKPYRPQKSPAGGKQ